MNHSFFRKITFLIFAVSVFSKSSRFVETENAAKFYFTAIFFLLTIILITIWPPSLILDNRNTWKNVAKNFFLIGLMQAAYGLLQYINISHNYHGQSIVGSFDNTAGFAALLSLVLPLGINWFIKSKGVEKLLSGSGIIMVIAVIFLSGSRAGILSIVLSMSVFLFYCNNLIKYIKARPLLSIVFISLIVATLAIGLYAKDKNSSNGRFLIWQVSNEMIKDKPLFGHGNNTFKAEYMDYQGRYFKENPDSKYRQLADNVKHPFNEFVLILVEFGIIGFILLLVIISISIFEAIKNGGEQKILFFSGLISIVSFSFFSYPLKYPPIWILIIFYSFVLLPSKVIDIKKTSFVLVIRFFVIGISFLSLYLLHNRIKAEIEWKKLAYRSLAGYTNEVLPHYAELYPELKKNPYFLYNYGAELNFVGRYNESINILNECQKTFNDYDLQLLLGDNYRDMGDSIKAIALYENASNMIPCRFRPLYRIFKIYKDMNAIQEATIIAEKIVTKEVKIPSPKVASIVNDAKIYLKEHASVRIK